MIGITNHAYAQSYRVESRTIGRITQSPRSDGSLDPQRTFMQQVGVGVYDATGTRDGMVNGYVGMRYATDFGIEQSLRTEDEMGIWWNYFALDEAWAELKPMDSLRIRGGRQLHLDALGMRDFDGGAISLTPRMGKSVRGVLEVYGGRDVQFEGGEVDSDAYDVQGVGFDSDFADAAAHWLVGGRTGLRWSDASFELGYVRRQYDLQPSDAHDTELALGEERFGAAMAAHVSRDVNLSGQASFNSVINTVDNARFQVASRIVPLGSILSGGVEHRVPWFDSGSIWNIFGAQPRQGAFLTYQQPVAKWLTTFEARSWSRIYHGDYDHWDWGNSDDDEVAFGGGLGHTTRVDLWEHPVQVRNFASVQSSVESGYGGDQFLWDSSIRGQTPGLRSSRLTLRALVLHARTSNWRRPNSTMVTGVAQFAWPTQIGDLGLTAELSQSSDVGGNSRFFVVYEIEAWP